MRNFIAISVIAAAALACTPAQAVLTLVDQYNDVKNDCKGQGGFSNCYASASGVSQGQPSGGGGSAAVFKFGSNGETDKSNNYPSILGTEFAVTYVAGSNTLSFTYTPGLNDPSIHYVAVKQSDGFALFYDVNPITFGSFNLSTYFPNNPGYSHITFFNGGATTPGAVPEPAAWALMIGGFALVGASLRRRKVAPSFA